MLSVTLMREVHEGMDTPLLTRAPCVLDMPTTFPFDRSKTTSSGSVGDTAEGKKCVSAGKQMSLGNKRLGMGRSALGYCPNKKARVS